MSFADSFFHLAYGKAGGWDVSLTLNLGSMVPKRDLGGVGHLGLMDYDSGRDDNGRGNAMASFLPSERCWGWEHRLLVPDTEGFRTD